MECLADDGCCRFEATVADDGADERFQRIGQNGRPRGATGSALARAEVQERAQLQIVGDGGKRLGVDEFGSHQRQLLFAGVWLGIEQKLCDHETERCIAKELEALEVVGARTAMGQCQLQQRRILKNIAKAVLQPTQSIRASGHDST